MFIVTTEAVLPSIGSIFFTLPTSTPAIRTGDFGFRLLALSTTAFTWYGRVSGTSLPNTRKVKMAISSATDRPAANGVMLKRFLRGSTRASCPSVLVA